MGATFTIARFLGKSRMISLFGGLVAAAGLVNELQKRREHGSNPGEEG